MALVGGVPVGIMVAGRNRKIEYFVLFLIVFFTAQNIDINFVSREWIRGTSRGFSIGLIDLASMILCALAFQRRKRYPITYIPPGTVLYFLYFFFSAISIVNAANSLMSLFELWNMFRMYLFYWVMYNYLQTGRQISLIMKFISGVILFIAYTVLKQKYLGGLYRPPGPFPHSNSLVMYLIIFNSLAFAYLLNVKKSSIFYWLTVFALGSFSLVSTLSSAGMAVYSIAIAIILMLSYTQGFSTKKLVVTTLLALAGMFGVLMIMDTLIERFTEAPEESGETRVDLAIAAQKMADDKVLGIGLNNFGIKIQPPYEYNSHMEYDENNPEDANNLILVETIYMMIAAETGWHNLVVFLLFLGQFYMITLINLFRYRKSAYSFVPIGLQGGLTAIYLESALEWVLKQTNNVYQLMLVFAMIGMLSRNYTRDRKRKRLGTKNRA